MVATNQENRELVALLSRADISGQGRGLTGAQIALAYKAALADFALGKTARAAANEVSKFLAGCLAARRQELSEDDRTSSQRLSNFY